jgi:hypothetical protein
MTAASARVDSLPPPPPEAIVFAEPAALHLAAPLPQGAHTE